MLNATLQLNSEFPLLKCLNIIPLMKYHKDYTMLMPTKFAVSIESPLLTTSIGLITLFS